MTRWGKALKAIASVVSLLRNDKIKQGREKDKGNLKRACMTQARKRKKDAINHYR